MSPSPSAGRVPGDRGRLAPRVLVVCLLALLASGCLRFRGDLRVGDDTVSGTIVVAVQNLAGSTAPSFASLPAELRDRVAVAAYNEDGYTGSTLTLTRLPFDRFDDLLRAVGASAAPSLAGLAGLTDLTNLGLPGLPTPSAAPAPGPSGKPAPSASASRGGAVGGSTTTDIALRRDGDQVRVSGTFFFPLLTFGADPTGSFDARLAMTFGGDVVSTNGERDGRTVTWRFRLGQAQPVQAVAFRGGSGPASVAWTRYGYLGGTGVLVALVVGIAVIAFRRRSAAPVDGSADDLGLLEPAAVVAAPAEAPARGGAEPDIRAWARPAPASPPIRYTRHPRDGAPEAPRPPGRPAEAAGAAAPTSAPRPSGPARPARTGEPRVPSGAAAPMSAPRGPGAAPPAPVGPGGAAPPAPSGAAARGSVPAVPPPPRHAAQPDRVSSGSPPRLSRPYAPAPVPDRPREQRPSTVDPFGDVPRSGGGASASGGGEKSGAGADGPDFAPWLDPVPSLAHRSASARPPGGRHKGGRHRKSAADRQEPAAVPAPWPAPEPSLSSPTPSTHAAWPLQAYRQVDPPWQPPDAPPPDQHAPPPDQHVPPPGYAPPPADAAQVAGSGSPVPRGPGLSPPAPVPPWAPPDPR